MEVVAMDMIMGNAYYELENSGCSSTFIIEDEIDCNWNNWDPVVDWGPLSSDPNDFHSLIESMMLDNEPLSSTTSCDESPLLSSMTSCNESPLSPLHVGDVDDDKELRLVHLLVAAAEALGGPHKSQELARVILVRLRELVPPVVAAGGTNVERLAAHFTEALQGLLDGPAGATHFAGRFHHRHHHHQHREDHQRLDDVLLAVQLLQDMSPCVKFGYFTTNQAILEAVSGDRRVHIIDYDIMEGLQWASLMQALVTRKDSPPPTHLRITALTRNNSSGGGGGKNSTGSVQEIGRRLAAFAASIGQPFSFGHCRLDPDEKFRPSAIKVVKGETLIANCVLHPPHLPHRPATSVASFLTGAAALSAKLVTLVEEEGQIIKGNDENGFVGQFINELYRYSAIWDSLEAGFPMQGRARELVERVIFGPRIGSAVRRAYWREEEEKEGERGWGDLMSRMGFGRVGFSFFNLCQARLLLGLFNDGYKAEEDAVNKLVLGWKSRRLISASVWSTPPPSPPSSTTSSGCTS